MGNPWRGDDGAGVEVARRLAEAGVRAVAHEGDQAALLDLWAGEDEVVVVDAASSGAPAGTVHRFDAVAGPLPARLLRATTHTFGIAEAIELARALDRLPAAVTVVAVEGEAFVAGAGLTPAVARAVEDLERELRRRAAR